MDRNRLDFSIDRKSKNDLTASTLYYLQINGYTGKTEFYELTSGGTIVPYGDRSADGNGRTDVWMIYRTERHSAVYPIELKDRWEYSSDSGPILRGSFLNPGKKEYISGIKENDGITSLWAELCDDGKGTIIIPLWAELYNNGKGRIWNLSKINLDALPKVERMIKRINIDPDGKREPQKRFLLPIDKAIMIERKNGN